MAADALLNSPLCSAWGWTHRPLQRTSAPRVSIFAILCPVSSRFSPPPRPPPVCWPPVDPFPVSARSNLLPNQLSGDRQLTVVSVTAL